MAAPEDDLPDLRRTLPERAASWVLPACACEWAAAEVMHLAGQPGTAEVLIGTVASAAVAYGASARHKRVPAWTAWAIAGAGGWLSAALALGPVKWPAAVAWAALSLYAARKARRHPAVVEAREWRQARQDWLVTCRQWGLHGSHLLAHDFTRLGEDYLVDVSSTGKLSSAVARSDLPERIATHRRIPKSRVTVTEPAIAGQVRISVRDRDPWAQPILHPLLDTEPQEFLAPADDAVIAAIQAGTPPTIRRPVPVGQDPATGRILHVPLWDEHGGKNVTIVGIKGSGKGVLLNNISERVTAAPDALMIRVNISKKGAAEARRWGAACHLTAFGPEQASRALQVLRIISGIIDWRSRQHYDTDVFIPSPEDPLVVLFIDEIGAAMKYPKIRAELEAIASTGRELGVTAVRAGQRGTAQWTGGADVRSQDDVFCLGAVNRSSEAMHAAGELGLRLPDMASYGEGQPGVWVVAELGDQSGRAGRTWKLSEPPDVAAIARQRAASQPDLPAACREFLGEQYARLLGTDVYARFAHGASLAPPPEAAPATEHGPAAQPAPAAVATATADSTLEQLDWDMDMDDTTRARLRELDAKNNRTLGFLAETAAMDRGPDVPAEKLRESAAERWRQVGEQAEIPAESLGRLLDLLKGGTTTSKVAAGLGVKPWTARTWLEKLRGQGVAMVTGERRTAKWVLRDQEPPEPAGDGDGS